MAFAPANTLFDEIIDFLASAPLPEQLIAYQPPEALQNRLSELLEQNRQRQLTASEQTELEEFLQMNRFMSRLQVRARQKLANS